MSAAVLREAAAVARRDWEQEVKGPFKEAARIHLAVARWLDSAADHMDPELVLDGGCPDCEQDGALTVARAYLGSDQ